MTYNFENKEDYARYMDDRENQTVESTPVQDGPDLSTPEGFKTYIDSRASEQTNSFIKGIKSGINQTSALLGDALPGLLNSMLGDDEGAQAQFLEYQAAIDADAQANPREVASYQDIKFGENTLDYVGRALGEGLTSFLPSLVAGGGLGLLAREGVKRSASKYAKDHAKSIIKNSMKVGVLAGGLSQNAPETWVNLKSEGLDSPMGALVAGSLKTALDVLPIFDAVKRLSPAGEIGDAITDKLLSRLTKQAVRSGWQEGITESAQEGIDIAAEAFLLDNKEMFTVDNLHRLIDSGLQGMIAGSAIGGVMGSIQSPSKATETKEGASDAGTGMESKALTEDETVVGEQEENLEFTNALAETPPTVIPEQSAFTDEPIIPITPKEAQEAPESVIGTDEDLAQLEEAERFQSEYGESRFQKLAEVEVDGNQYFQPEVLERARQQSHKSGDTLTYMSPADFLAVAKEGFDDSKKKTVDNLLTEETQFDSIPHLSFGHDGNGSATVLSHEGRHRMRGLAEKGVEKVPVLLSSQYRRGRHEGQVIRWQAQDSEFDRLKDEFPVTLSGEDQKGTKVPFPAQDPRIQKPVTEGDVLTEATKPFIRSVKMTPDAEIKTNPIIKHLTNIIQSIAGKAVTFNPMAEMTLMEGGKATPLRGAQTGNVIQIALNTLDPSKISQFDETAYHEAWHFIREETDVFSKSDEMILDQSLPQMKEALINEYGIAPRDIEVLGTKSEIEATLFGMYADKKFNGKPVPAMGRLNRVLDKLVNLLKAIGKAFRSSGIKEFNEVFDDVLSGGMANASFDKAINESRVVRLQKTANTIDGRELARGILDKAPAPKIQDASTAVQHASSFEGLSAYTKWLYSMPQLASKNPLMAKVVNLFTEQQQETSRISKVLQEQIVPLMGKQNVFTGKRNQQRLTFLKATDAMNLLEESGQDITYDRDGLLTYKNAQGQQVKQTRDTSDAFKGLQEVFKSMAHLMEANLRDGLTEQGVERDATLPELQEKVVELKEKQKEMRKATGKTDKALENRTKGLQENVKNLNRINDILVGNKPYLPHMWFGRNVMWVYDRSILAELKEQYPVESEFKKMRWKALTDMRTIEEDIGKRPQKKQVADTAKELKSLYPTSEYELVGLTGKNILTHTDITQNIPESMLSADLVSSLIGSGEGDLYDALMTRLESKLGSKGMQKLFRDRKGVKGYSQDWERVILTYFSTLPKTITNMKYGPTTNRIKADVAEWEINATTKKEILDYMAYTTAPTSDMIGVRLFNFMYAMGLNMSSAILQFVTLPTATASLMSQWNGNIISNLASIAKSTKDGFVLESRLKMHDQNMPKVISESVKKGTLTPDEGALLQKAWDNGKLQAALSEDQLGVTSYEKGLLPGNTSGVLTKLGDIAAGPIQMAEQITRITSLLSLYRSQSNKAKTDSAFDVYQQDERFKEAWSTNTQFTPKEFVAIYGVDEAHAIFGKAGRGKNQRGIWGSFIFPFMTHPIQIMELIFRQAKSRGAKGKRAALVHVGMYVLLSGIQGLPGEELLEELYVAYMRIFGGTRASAQKDFRDAMVDLGFSPRLSRGIVKGGVSELLDIDVGRRMSIPLWPQNVINQGIKALSGEKMDTIDRMAGMAGSLAGSIQKVMDPTRTVSPGEAIGALAPVALRNMYEGLIGYNSRGVTTSRGKRVGKAEEMTAFDSFNKAVGFESMRASGMKETARFRELEKGRGSLGKTKYTRNLADIQIGYIEAKRAGDKDRADAFLKERKKVQIKLLKHLRKYNMQTTMKEVNTLINRKVKEGLNPGMPASNSKKYDERKVQRNYNIKRDE